MPRTTAAFDAAIAALVRARSLHPRLDALAEVIFQLHGIRAKAPSRGLPSRGDVPLALRWLYANYARHPRIMGRFNRIFPRCHLSLGPGSVVTFLAENQCVFLLGYRPGPADPTVLGNKHGFAHTDGWSLEDISISHALAAHILNEFALTQSPGVFASRATTGSLLSAVAGLTFIPFGWRIMWNLHLWAGGGTVLSAVEYEPNSRKGDPWNWTIHAAARRRRDLAFLDPLLPTWDLDWPGGMPDA